MTAPEEKERIVSDGLGLRKNNGGADVVELIISLKNDVDPFALNGCALLLLGSFGVIIYLCKTELNLGLT